MLKFQCPHCQYSLSLKQPKAGRFRPTCNGCHQTFELQIAADLTNFSVRAAAATEATAPKRTAAAVDGTRADVPATATFHTDSETRIDAAATRAQPARDNRAAAPAHLAQPPAERLGGYRLLKELGRGGLGVVYLAKQLSLNRHVAVKLIQTQLASSSTAVSRFFREAYAAAQLVHHNVVQIYDLGQEGGTNFFSMEFVQGQNLADLVKQNGPLEPRLAAGYILQAARGLQFAHHQGMVHRDVKPANLMLDQFGVVKVADLGLVKLPATADEPVESNSGGAAGSGSIQLTGAGATVGTVNYISPEQASSSSEVDHRADIYSLGCTFYALLTGRPPFIGTNANEVLAKHKSEKFPRPEALAPRVDRSLSDILMRMVEKRPENRYPNLGELIGDLQSYLGIATNASFAPTQEQVRELDASLKSYYGQPLAQARTYLPLGFFALGLMVTFVVALGSFTWAFACLSALVAAPLAAFLTAGLRQQSPLFDKLRELAAISGIKPWIMGIAGGLLLVVILYALGMFFPWLVAAVIGAGLGIGYSLVIEQGLAAEREKGLEGIRQWLRRQRMSGVDEADLQKFIAQNSGANWEEYFEDLFGYEALQRAKLDVGLASMGPRRKRFRPWRDTLIQRINRRLEARRQERDVDKLRSIEQKGLVAGGMSPEQAAAEAERMTQLLVEEATKWRSAAAHYQPSHAADPQAAVFAKRARIKAMLAEARSGAGKSSRNSFAHLDKLLDLALGAHVRLIVGALLIAGCALWIRQNNMLAGITTEKIQAAASSIQQGTADLGDLASQAGLESGKTHAALSLPIVGPWVSNFNSGIAGILLVISVIFGGWRASLWALPLAGVIWLGPMMALPGLLE